MQSTINNMHNVQNLLNSIVLLGPQESTETYSNP